MNKLFWFRSAFRRCHLFGFLSSFRQHRVEHRVAFFANKRTLMWVFTLFLLLSLLLLNPLCGESKLKVLSEDSDDNEFVKHFSAGAWQTAAFNNDELIDGLKSYNIIKSPEVEKAMRAVLRENYVRSTERDSAYVDSPQPIGYGQTISAPHMHALALELLKDFAKPGAKVLDVGSGSGYLSACFAMMVGPTGKVIGIDRIPELVKWSIENVKRDNPQLLETGRLKLMVGDGWAGVPSEAPFNAIHVGAAAPHIPQALIDQLAVGGRMVIPVGEGHQIFMQVDKVDVNTIRTTEITSVAYVPLVKDPKTRK